MSIKLLIAGGLGNQMFQYAAARAMALGLETELIIDTRFYSSQAQSGPMRFCIGDLPIKARIACYRSQSEAHALRKRVLRALVTERANVRYHEPRLGFHRSALHVKDGTVITGNFQSEKYFARHTALIRKELDLTSLFRPPPRRQATVSVHVRRGDYASHDGFMMKDPARYYAAAMSYISERHPGASYLVFSDDIVWCQKQPVFKSCEFYTPELGQDHRVDLLSMSRCAHHIIANSSFSWWGAWLDWSHDKIVIAPEYWLGQEKACDIDIVPDHWVVI